jgi:hypothetical protein
VALLPDRLPAYVTRERYEAIQQRLAENRARAESRGAPREGASLLAGLVVCAGCAHRRAVHYSGRDHQLRYACRSGAAGCRKPLRSITGRVLDALLVEQVLVALQPGALELSLAAADDVIQERRRLDENWRQRRERARDEAQRAERQYQAVELDNRLVARTLEQRWEEALKEVRRVEEEYARFQRRQPTRLTRREVEQIRGLAQDLPALWQAATTTAVDRQQVIRFLVERVVVAVCGDSNQAQVTVEWVGGCASQHALIRAVLSYRQMAETERLLARICELRAEGWSFARIANALNAEGFHPSKQTQDFSGDTVGILGRKHLAPALPRGRHAAADLRQREEWTALDLANELGMPKNTLLAWLKNSWVRFRRLPGYRGRCLCWADAAELKRLRKLRDTPHGWWDPPLPAALTTPKPRQ